MQSRICRPQRQLTSGNAVALGGFLILWSSGAVATAVGLEHMAPSAFLLLRTTVTAVCAWLLWPALRGALPRTARAWAAVVGTGVFMQMLYQGLFFLSLDAGIAPGLLALIVACQPLVTAILTRQSGWLSWMGIVLGFTGLLLACSPELRAGSSTTLGVMAAAGALAALTAAVLIQTHVTDVGVVPGLALQATMAVPVFVVICMILRVPVPEAQVGVVLPVVWMGVVVGVLATGALYWLVRSMDVVLVTSVQFLVPAATALLDFLVRGQPLAPITLIGMGLVILALFVFDRGRRSRASTTGSGKTEQTS
ncbi:DMT family transporter [Kocuria sp. SL71]|uniref:DMT family transporter n=1 Tax=Kocuria sp. SL71 TaxID=2995151 RepID=UPI002275DE4C|nr:DMT family transporter [Kocuria sp. SL71]MCY1685162.1 DMT family transporter [Kocuria sp. SL71]